MKISSESAKRINSQLIEEIENKIKTRDNENQPNWPEAALKLLACKSLIFEAEMSTIQNTIVENSKIKIYKKDVEHKNIQY